MLRTKYFPEMSPTEILWYDHWPAHNSIDSDERFHRVELTWNSAKRVYKGPVWGNASEMPDALRDEVHRVIEAANDWTKQKGGTPQKRPHLPTSYLPFAEHERFRFDFIHSEEDISACLQVHNGLMLTLNSYHELVRFGRQFDAVRKDYSEFNVAGYSIFRSGKYVFIRSGGMQASFTADEYHELEQFVGDIWQREDVAKVLADLKAFYE